MAIDTHTTSPSVSARLYLASLPLGRFLAVRRGRNFLAPPLKGTLISTNVRARPKKSRKSKSKKTSGVLSAAVTTQAHLPQPLIPFLLLLLLRMLLLPPCARAHSLAQVSCPVRTHDEARPFIIDMYATRLTSHHLSTKFNRLSHRDPPQHLPQTIHLWRPASHSRDQCTCSLCRRTCPLRPSRLRLMRSHP